MEAKIKAYESAKPYLPDKHTLAALTKAAKHCQGCPLYKAAKQTVFGEGKATAKIMIVGEIPGEKEDQIGRPFVGPAGKLLRDILLENELDLADVYLTNVVKHFKFEYLRNRKMHRSPVMAEVKACLPWLTEEINIIQPQFILCLGAVAAKVLINKKIQIRAQHGEWFLIFDNLRAMATYHPSAILRTIDRASRHEMRGLFTRDVKKLAKALHTK